MSIEVLVLAECYANKCFAEEVRDKLREVYPKYRFKIIHKSTYGRDRILSKAKRIQQTQQNSLILLFIDYERGPLRKYVETLFPHLESIASISNVYIGKSSLVRNLVAVIFDPDIEGALGIRAGRTRRILKTVHACRELQSLLASKSEAIEEVASKVASLMGE